MRDHIWLKIIYKIIHCHTPLIQEEHEGEGIPRSEEVIDGRLFLLSYGRVATLAIDPIEKKPLYHYLPGVRYSPIISLLWEIS